MIQEKLLGNIGLNMDDDPRYFGENDTNHIVNMLPDSDDNGGLLKTLDGNTEIPTNIDWVLTSSRKVIGSCKRASDNMIYYFVKGLSVHGDATTTTTPPGFDYDNELDFEYNSIIEFNPVMSTFRVIVFEEQHLYMGDWVVGAQVIGDYLIYNSGAHGVRKVHIEYAYRYYNGIAGATYPEITSTTFALRNLPPLARPVCNYATPDPTRYQNNIINKTFQFAYRYKYVDAGYSVYSEFSDICLPPNLEKWNGEYVTEQYQNNAIAVLFSRGDLDVIEYVEIIFREGNNGTWKFWKSVYADESLAVFYNDESYESVEQDEVNKVEDAISRTVSDATLINENRLVLAGLTEGFDKVDIAVSMTPVAERVELVDPSTYIGNIKAYLPVDELSIDDEGVGIGFSGLTYGDFNVGDVLNLTFQFGGITPAGKSIYQSSYVFTAPDLASADDFHMAIYNAINNLIGTSVIYIKSIGKICSDPLIPTTPAVWNSSMTATYDMEIQLTFSGTWPLYGEIKILDGGELELTGTNRWNTYKSGSVHPHAIQYWDEEFRRSTIMRSPACDVLVRERGFYAVDQSITTTTGWDAGMDYRIKIDWIISHQAPAWAKYWSWVYAGNKTQSNFVQYIIGTRAINDGYLELDIAPLQNLKTNTVSNPLYNSIIDPYVFVPGDRIRILTGAPEGDFLGDSLRGIYYYDLPIAGLDDTTLRIASPDSNYFGSEEGSLIEIYTPRSFDDDYEPYFLVGKINEVIDGLHMNPDGTSQTVGSPARGTLESGDAYVIGRAFSEDVGATPDTTGKLFVVESMHWSDFYQSNAYDRGKLNIYSSIGEVTLNNVRWGWKRFVGSSVNNLFTFDPPDYKPLADIYGAIVRIGEVGDILKIIFEHKIASMYIGKREVYDASGSVFQVADSVLSNPNYSIEDYGTTDPRAVLFVRGYLYFIDFHAGAVVRNTNNGSYPISGKADAGGEGADYKMHSYFRDICINVLRWNSLSPCTPIIGWDDGRKLLYVSILQPGFSERTAVYRESRGRWVSLLEFHTDPDTDSGTLFPTCYEWAGNKFFSWLDGSDSVWTHSYRFATPLSIYGHVKQAQIAIWGNAAPNVMKSFDSIAIHTNVRGWEGLVEIPASVSYPHGMQSMLPADNFEAREGVLYADYMGNIFSHYGEANYLGLYDGESMRGYVIGNYLYISSEAWLFKVDINYRVSNV